jgi:polysaccharide deacetylase family protein (PEP-CTERM system associated)
MIHALTIDVEDEQNVVARDWLGRDGPPSRRVVENTHRLLEHCATHGARATFFVLGEVAATYPELIREIAAGGHELGVHGFYHRQLFKLTPESFRTEVADAKAMIEDLIGAEAPGHRAPAFSIMPATRWGLDVLAEVGFRYDSSVFPIKGGRYGWPGFRRDIHEIRLESGRTIIEAPLSTVSFFGKRLPVCGGGYFRHFPGGVTRWAMRRIERERPAIIYLHPYEIDVSARMPDMSGLDRAATNRMRRYYRLQLRNRDTVEGKLDSILRDFEFKPLGEAIDYVLGAKHVAESCA